MIYRIVAVVLMLTLGVISMLLHGDKLNSDSKPATQATQPNPNPVPSVAPAGNKNFNF